MRDVRPALVGLVLTRCAPGVAAYEATILDLAARGFVGISGGPDELRVTVTGRPAAGLAGYEQQVLGDVRARLAEQLQRVTVTARPRTECSGGPG